MKEIYDCVGGPFHGKQLWLADSPTTAFFRLKHWHGRYVGHAGGYSVYWQECR